MPSIFVATKPLINPDEIWTEDGLVKIRDGMTKFGGIFADKWINGTSKDALIDTFVTLDNIPTEFGIYGIVEIRPGDFDFLVLKAPKYSKNEKRIIFDIINKGRKFQIIIRQDNPYIMNVWNPIFSDPSGYLENVVKLIQGKIPKTKPVPMPEINATNFLLANSLISRCK